MEQRHDEFRFLQSKALAILSDATPPDVAHPSLIIRLHVEPAFGDFASRYVFADDDETTFLLRKTVWQRPFDAQRFTQPLMGLKHGWHSEPTVSIAMKPLPASMIAALLREARAMSAPDPDTKRGVSLDGTPHSLYMAGAFGEHTYAWNAINVPQGWNDLAAWMQGAVEVMDNDY